jgi:hypothetical protein
MRSLIYTLFFSISIMLLNARLIQKEKFELWGFYGHQKINGLATFTLPIEMIGFYKHYILYITEKSVTSDMRRYIMPEEAARHYIDMDVYGDSALHKMPRYWNQAVEKYTEDTLNAYGVVPWHIVVVKNRLTRAFKERNVEQILKQSSDLGHYIADAHVPLHTTHNYNGQFSNQYGIHGFWESRLPELFSEEYDFFTGQATYIENPQLRAWDAVISAHLALDSVFQFEKELTDRFDNSLKFGIETRGNSLMRVYSYNFSKEYHYLLDGMVERQMKLSIKMIGDFWYTCWVDGGQPNLNELAKLIPIDTVLLVTELPISFQNHESGEVKN